MFLQYYQIENTITANIHFFSLIAILILDKYVFVNSQNLQICAKKLNATLNIKK